MKRYVSSMFCFSVKIISLQMATFVVVNNTLSPNNARACSYVLKVLSTCQLQSALVRRPNDHRPYTGRSRFAPITGRVPAIFFTNETKRETSQTIQQLHHHRLGISSYIDNRGEIYMHLAYLYFLSFGDSLLNDWMTMLTHNIQNSNITILHVRT